jgi:hypothetical protein
MLSRPNADGISAVSLVLYDIALALKIAISRCAAPPEASSQ